jgi:regulator of protease activity HflC (stomatin/prohibitin superfamily)
VTDLPDQVSKALIERIRKEREQLLQQIEESQKTIERSQDLLAQLDAMLVKFERT